MRFALYLISSNLNLVLNQSNNVCHETCDREIEVEVIEEVEEVEPVINDDNEHDKLDDGNFLDLFESVNFIEEDTIDVI